MVSDGMTDALEIDRALDTTPDEAVPHFDVARGRIPVAPDVLFEAEKQAEADAQPLHAAGDPVPREGVAQPPVQPVRHGEHRRIGAGLDQLPETGQAARMPKRWSV